MRSKSNKKCNNFIKSLDSFGHPIQFTYNNSSTFKSTIGGYLTLVARLGIVIYLILELINVAQKKSSIRFSTYIRDLATDKSEYTIDQSQFDLAALIKLQSQINDTYNTTNNMHKYAYVQISELKFVYFEKNGQLDYDFVLKPFDLVKCDETRFLGQKEIMNNLGILKGNYQCPKNFNLTLQGSFSSQSSQFLRVELKKCDQNYLNQYYPNETCANQQEIDEVFDGLELFVPVINQYFDAYDVETLNPIKTTIQVLYYTAQSNFSQNYLIKIAQNFAVTRDSSLSSSISERNLTYYSIETKYSFFRNQDSASAPVIMNILLDETVSTTEREVYTISDALAATGGFLEIIRIIAATIVGGIQAQLYYQSIISKLLTSDYNNISHKNLKAKISKKKETLRTSQIYDSNQSIQVQNITQENLNKSNGVTMKTVVDQDQDNKQQTMLNFIIELIKNRSNFKFTFNDYLRSLLRKARCIQKNKYFHRKAKLFELGKQRVDQKFEILNVFRLINYSKVVSQIFLHKYQMLLIPYFENNVLRLQEKKQNDSIQTTSLQKMKSHQAANSPSQNKQQMIVQTVKKWDKYSNSQRKDLEQSIQRIVESSQLNSKQDQRILKFLVDQSQLGIFKNDQWPRNNKIIGDKTAYQSDRNGISQNNSEFIDSSFNNNDLHSPFASNQERVFKPKRIKNDGNNDQTQIDYLIQELEKMN
eukprot:403365765